MKKETEQKLISDVEVIKCLVTEIKETVRRDHDRLQSLSTIKVDMDKKFDGHVITERWVFGFLFIIVVAILTEVIFKF